MNKSLTFKPSKLLLLPQVLNSIFLIVLITLLAFPRFEFNASTNWVYLPIVILIALGTLSTVNRYRQLFREQYVISDTAIQIQTSKDDRTYILTNIREISSKEYWWLPFSKMGKIEIYANGRYSILRGIKDAKETAAIILMAVEAAIANKKKRPETSHYQPPIHTPGTLEPMNDLVGMWQQGLISDEDFESEKRKFNK